MNHSTRLNSILVVIPKGRYVTSPNLYSYPLTGLNWPGQNVAVSGGHSQESALMGESGGPYNTRRFWSASRLSSGFDPSVG